MVARYALKGRISDLKEQSEIYSKKISADSASISEIKKSNINLEKFARERYYMKRDNEDIFIITEWAELLELITAKNVLELQ